MMYCSPQGKKGGCMEMVPACRYALFICTVISYRIVFREDSMIVDMTINKDVRSVIMF